MRPSSEPIPVSGLRPAGKTFRLIPDAWVIKIGGQSVIDRGSKALLPLVKEITANIDSGKRLVIGTGAGTRARHIYRLGVDLGLPTGVLSELGAGVAVENARMLGWLLSSHGIPIMTPEELSSRLAFNLKRIGAVIFPGMPPYTYWEHYPEIGLIPPHRTDTGCFLVAEAFGVAGLIYVKDEDGLYTDDPKKNPDAKFIPKIRAKELIDRNLPDLVVEHPVVNFMQKAKNIHKFQVINGLKPGNLTRALNGEHVGTIIEN